MDPRASTARLEPDRMQLVSQHLPLVRVLARRYARGVELDDLVGAGSLGLVKAARRFQPSRGIEFRSFAVQTIAGEMQHFIRDCAGPVRLPRRDQEVSRGVRRAEQELVTRLGRTPTDAELVRACDADREVLARAARADLARRPASLSEWEELDQQEDAAGAELRASLASALKRLPRNERQVVRLRFFADLSQSEIAKRTGISQTQVSRLLTAALARLRAELGDDQDSSPNDRTNPETRVEEKAVAAYTRGHGDRTCASAIGP